MATTERIEISQYICEPCSIRQNTPVTELVRMIKDAVVMDGKLVGDEWWCCPICYDAKFLCRTKEAKEVYLARTEKARKKEAELNERRRATIKRHLADEDKVVQLPVRKKTKK